MPPADPARATPRPARRGPTSCSSSSRASTPPTRRPPRPGRELSAELRPAGRPGPRSADEARAASARPADPARRRAGQRRPARTCSTSRRCRRRSATPRSTRTRRCPLRYAFERVYRIPTSRTVGALTLRHHRARGLRALHAGASRAARARRAPPTREDLRAAASRPSGRPASSRTRPPRRTTGGAWPRCSTTSGRASSRSIGQAEAEELDFELVIEVPGGAPGHVHGQDRPHRPAARRAASRSSTTRPATRELAEGRPREPAALHLRARLPRRPRLRHAGAGDALLHRVTRRG